MAQVEGYYPRINVKMLSEHLGSIVSLVGSVTAFDGTGMTLQSGEGGSINITCDPGEFSIKPGDTIECIGVAENNSLQVSMYVLDRTLVLIE